MVAALVACSPEAEPGPRYQDCQQTCWVAYDAGRDNVFRAAGAGPYFLPLRPVPGSLSVAVEEQGVWYDFEENVDWTWDPVRNAFAFVAFVPAEGASVVAWYEVEQAAFAGVRCSDVVMCP